MQADSLYGRAPQDSQVDASLQGLNKSKAQDKKPLVVKPGENGMRNSGQAVMGDPRDFQRVGSRGVFGGLNYEYVDPVTKRRYSTEQYNTLIGE